MISCHIMKMWSIRTLRMIAWYHAIILSVMLHTVDRHGRLSIEQRSIDDQSFVDHVSIFYRLVVYRSIIDQSIMDHHTLIVPCYSSHRCIDRQWVDRYWSDWSVFSSIDWSSLMTMREQNEGNGMRVILGWLSGDDVAVLDNDDYCMMVLITR